MAMTSSFFLQSTTHNDDMDVSNSPAHRVDEDIEIDLDDALTHNDEQMGEDEDRLTVDDEMHDDDPNTAAATATSKAYADEEDLIDYSDDDVVIEPQPVDMDTPFAGAKPDVDYDEEHFQDQEPILDFEEHDTLTLDEETHEEEEAAADPGDDTSHTIQELEEEEAGIEENAHAAAGEPLEHTDSQEHDEQAPEDHTETATIELGEHDIAGDEEDLDKQEHNEHQSAESNLATKEYEDDNEQTNVTDLAVDTSAAPVAHPELVDDAQDAQDDDPGSPSDTGLHPIFLAYQGTRLPLFKSKTARNGLLKDDNLVSLSLANLIDDCRKRLATALDSQISEVLDIFLTFVQLRLTVMEGSKASFLTSLKDVLDTYVQLMINDGHEEADVPALDIICETQFKFNHSIVRLQNAVAQGQGLSSFITPETHDDDDYQYDDIQHDDQDDDGDVDDTANAEDTTVDPELHLDEDELYDYAGEEQAEEHEEEAEEEDAEQVELNGDEHADEGYEVSLQEHDDEVEDTEQAEAAVEVAAASDTADDAAATSSVILDLTEANDVEPVITNGADQEEDAATGQITATSDLATADSTKSIAAPPADSTTATTAYEDDLIDYSDDEDPGVAEPTKTTPTKRGRETTDEDEMANKKPRAS